MEKKPKNKYQEGGITPEETIDNAPTPDYMDTLRKYKQSIIEEKRQALDKERESEDNKLMQWMTVLGQGGDIRRQAKMDIDPVGVSDKFLQDTKEKRVATAQDELVKSIDNYKKFEKDAQNKGLKIMNMGSDIVAVDPITGEIKQRHKGDKKSQIDPLDLMKYQLDRDKFEYEKTKKEDKPKKLSKGQEALDRNFAKSYEEYVGRGGASSVQKNIEQLEEAGKMLEQSDSLSGPIVGNLPKVFRDTFLPESSSVQEAIEEVVQTNLRLILGAQFTEKEAEKLIERAYNPKLPEAENKKRLNRLIEQIKDAAKEKERAIKYFEDNDGTLAGFKGTLPQSADDFLNNKKPKMKESDKVVVEKDGKRFKLPKNQLESAKKQGYKLVE